VQVQLLRPGPGPGTHVLPDVWPPGITETMAIRRPIRTRTPPEPWVVAVAHGGAAGPEHVPAGIGDGDAQDDAGANDTGITRRDRPKGGPPGADSQPEPMMEPRP
jgi:hypothetical protein